MPRTRDGEIGTAPVTDRGKRVLAWDPAILPGGGEGTVLLNAHTWPDGSALGNRLLAGLRVGDRLRLRGARGAAACYRVRERTRFRRDRIPAAPTFRSWGPEQVVIIVCSGRRRGPGDWTHRTVWYLDPAPAAGPETGARTVARPH
ncbi:hypothetical protein [Nocardioides sp.]|uniref:hypothetical protein n=1 Tax=Nocardioides sp. TaxID=35761 RepID=UPI00351261FF